MLNKLKGLINEDRQVLLEKEDRISQLAASKDFHISAAIATFQTNNEKKVIFPNLFGLKTN